MKNQNSNLVTVDVDEKILEHFKENFEDCAEYIIDEAPTLEALGLFTKAIIEDSVEDLFIFHTEYMVIFNELTQKDF